MAAGIPTVVEIEGRLEAVCSTCLERPPEHGDVDCTFCILNAEAEVEDLEEETPCRTSAR